MPRTDSGMSMVATRGPAATTEGQPVPPATASRRMPDAALIVGPAVTLAVMLWGVGAASYWGDEADTVSAVSRTLPQLIQLLGHIDAVHGLYYLMLWPVARIAGTGQVAMRIPSAVAMAAAAAGVGAIARMLGSRRAAVCAGLIFATLPTVSSQAHDARPYAAVTAVAVLASYVLVRAARDPRPVLFAGYGLSLVLLGYVQLFGLLLVPAHAVTLYALCRRRQPGRDRSAHSGQTGRRFLVTVAAAGAAVAPVAVIGWAQRAQIAWIPAPGPSDAWDLAATLTAGSVAAAVLIGLLIAVGAYLGAARLGHRAPRGHLGPRWAGILRDAGRPDRRLTWLALPWLVLPPLILIAASVVKPVYFSRYIDFCLPAVALLAGAGLAALRLPLRAAALVLVAALVAPAQVAMRAPGGGMQAVAQFLSSREQPGDAIVYPEGLIPPWYIAYPDGFGGLRDLSLAQSPGAAGRLYATSVSRQVLLQRESGVARIWIVPTQGSRDPASYLAPGFRLAATWAVGGETVLLYTRTSPP